MPNTKQSLRQALRLKRAQLPLEEPQQKGEQLIRTAAQCPEFLDSQHIAAYWPIEGEISPLPLLQQAFSMGKQCYLPVLHPLKAHHLRFVEYKPNDPLQPNRFGILEPLLKDRKSIATSALNLIFIPLVAFDQNGRRLGTGGGYYDRTLSFMKTTLRSKKPILVGLAYEWQCVAELPEDPWDIPLNGIVTEERYIAITH